MTILLSGLKLLLYLFILKKYTSHIFLLFNQRKIFLKDGGRERAFKEGCLEQAETQRQGHRRNLQETVGSTIWLGKTSSWPRLEKGVVERPWMRDEIPGDRELQQAGETGNDACNKPQKVGNLDYLFLSLSAEPGLQ